MTEPTSNAPSERTRIRRGAQRANYDAATVHAIIDAALLAHVAWVADGEPRLIPTMGVRLGEYLYLHGNRNSAMIRALQGGTPAAVEMTCLDGLVIARSGFHCSVNYRSVVVFGVAEVVAEADKELVLDAFVDRLIPGRVPDQRPHTEAELAATTAVRLPLTEVSAKVRTGPPIDDDDDYDLPMWAGVLPLALHAGTPEPCPRLPADVAAPDYLAAHVQRLNAETGP